MVSPRTARRPMASARLAQEMGSTATDGTTTAHRSTKPKVVYVLGAGRSGSTILGVTLGNCADIFYAGELDKWLMRSGLPTRGGAERESFWRAVRAKVTGAEPLFGREVHQYLERSSGLFRAGGWSRRRRLRADYLRVTAQLYDAIAQTAGVTHVVDSAHYPLRARELQRIEEIDLYLVFLVRDPQSIVASFEREDVPEARFSARKTNAYLWLTYLLSLSVFLRQPRRRRLLLRHEDFLAAPDGVVRTLLERVDSPAEVPDLNSLTTGFPLVGNRLIKQDIVALQPMRSSPPRSWMTRLLQFPWSVIFTMLKPTAGPTPASVDRLRCAPR